MQLLQQPKTAEGAYIDGRGLHFMLLLQQGFPLHDASLGFRVQHQGQLAQAHQLLAPSLTLLHMALQTTCTPLTILCIVSVKSYLIIRTSLPAPYPQFHSMTNCPAAKMCACSMGTEFLQHKIPTAQNSYSKAASLRSQPPCLACFCVSKACNLDCAFILSTKQMHQPEIHEDVLSAADCQKSAAMGQMILFK